MGKSEPNSLNKTDCRNRTAPRSMPFPSISFQIICDLEDEHPMQTGIKNEIKLEGGKGERRENVQNEEKFKEMHALKAVNCHLSDSGRTMTGF